MNQTDIDFLNMVDRKLMVARSRRFQTHAHVSTVAGLYAIVRLTRSTASIA